MLGRFEFGIPVIDLEINNKRIICILDTGFNGEILLPERLIEELKLERMGATDYVAIEGVRRVTPFYYAEATINNKKKFVEVVSSKSNFILAGMKLLKEFRITLEQRKNLVLVE